MSKPGITLTTFWALRIYGPASVRWLADRTGQGRNTIRADLAICAESGYVAEIREGLWDVTEDGKELLRRAAEFRAAAAETERETKSRDWRMKWRAKR